MSVVLAMPALLAVTRIDRALSWLLRTDSSMAGSEGEALLTAL